MDEDISSGNNDHEACGIFFFDLFIFPVLHLDPYSQSLPLARLFFLYRTYLGKYSCCCVHSTLAFIPLLFAFLYLIDMWKISFRIPSKRLW